MLISVIIPCYNEEDVILESYSRLINVFKSNNVREYELLFINNGSIDKSLDILREIAAKDNQVKILVLSRNFGHQAAVSAGLNECKGSVAVIIDADLQDPPEVIIEMLSVYQKEQCNVVYGVRKKRKGENFFKVLTAKLYYRILNYLSDSSFPVDTGDFRLVDRKVIDAFKMLPEKNKYIRGLISWMGFKQLPVYFDRESRFAGESKYPVRNLFQLASTGLLYFSKKPLKLATSIGFISICIGIVMAIWALSYVIFGYGYIVAGWTSTIIIIIFFGGVQLLTIGVLGQYIGSLFDEVKSRPEYIISERIGAGFTSE